MVFDGPSGLSSAMNLELCLGRILTVVNWSSELMLAYKDVFTFQSVRTSTMNSNQARGELFNTMLVNDH